jgi:DNA polymerase-3 subunit delta'
MSSLNQHNTVLVQFKRLVDSSKLAHAYLLIGPMHSAKRELCLQLAQLFNCTHPQAPCGECISCRKIKSMIHPDVMMLTPLEDKQTVSIDQMRQLVSRLGYSPYEGKFKTVIIPMVEHLTTEAANAFLKTLEEPTQKTVILLTTANVASVLDTIKSRCQWVRLQPQGNDDLVNELYGHNIQESQAQWLSSMSNGFGAVALKMAGNTNIKDREVIIKSFLSSRVDDDTIKTLLEDKESLKDVLIMLMTLMADVFASKSAKITQPSWNRDLAREIEALSKLSMNELIAIYQQIIVIYRQLQENLNAKISLLVLKEQLCQPSSK